MIQVIFHSLSFKILLNVVRTRIFPLEGGGGDPLEVNSISPNDSSS